MKIKLILSLLIIALSMAACNKDLLDTAPDNKYTESNFWQSEEAVNSALNACYAELAYAGIYGGDATPLWEETATPNAYNNTNAMGYNDIAKGLQSASTGGIVSSRWSECYGGIGRCNTFLVKSDEVKMDAALKTRMKGEAHFLRALYYFMLETYYGDAPIILDPPNRTTQADLPRDPREKVVQQVLADLDSAAAVLPLKYSKSDVGRATKGAALGLKARVLLYEASPLFNESNDQSRWQKAADAAKAVMDMASQAGYGLYADYRKLFLPENENNKEVIFDIQFIYPDEGNSFDLICKQYNTNAPLQSLVDAYQMKDGLAEDESPLYNPNSPYENRDPRFYATVVFPGDQYMGETVTDDRFAITGYGLEKMSIYTEDAPPAGLSDLKSGQSYINYILIRYADILLSYAEAENEAVGPDASVYAAINKVRERAGMPDILPALTQAEMRQVIHHERRIEFAGEGLYYNDIRRWKTAETVLNESIYNWKHQKLEERKFDPSRDYWWPIPQEQLDLNPNLEQNAGY